MGERWQEIYSEPDERTALQVASGQLPKWGRVRVVMQVNHNEVVQEFVNEV